MAKNIKPLLRKHIYYEGCPGCKVEQMQETQEKPPFKLLVLLGFLVLSNALSISSLFPFVYFMVKDFNIARRVEDIGFYAGYIGSSFMFGRFLTSLFWGIAADRYGRKPVIIIGTLAVTIFNIPFGLTKSFWLALSMRLLLGCFNGSLGPVKAYAAELCRPEHQAWGMSVVGTTWGLGLIIGPAIGGFLSQPADNFPQLFSKSSIFGRFPYFLPCLVISLFAFAALFTCFWLPETLHMHHRVTKEHDPVTSMEASYGLHGKETLKEESATSNLKRSILKNWPLMSSIIIYCLYSLHSIAYTEIFSLWAVSAKSYGGLGFSSKDVGLVLSISGFGMLVFQLLMFPPIEKIIGPILVVRIGAVLTLPLLATYPLVANLSGFILFFTINVASILKNALGVMVFTGLFIQQNNAVPQYQRGAANGISTMAMSFFKAIGPAGAGSLFAWAQKHQHTAFLPGDQIVFFALNVIFFIVAVLTFDFFLPESVSKPSEKIEELLQ